MIKHISIRNFAIIEKTDIDFHDGLNIITGETRRGKIDNDRSSKSCPGQPGGHCFCSFRAGKSHDPDDRRLQRDRIYHNAGDICRQAGISAKSMMR